MKADGLLFATANFLVLGATACLEFFQLRGMMFGMGESGGPIGLLGSALLIMTALGILGVMFRLGLVDLRFRLVHALVRL